MTGFKLPLLKLPVKLVAAAPAASTLLSNNSNNSTSNSNETLSALISPQLIKTFVGLPHAAAAGGLHKALAAVQHVRQHNQQPLQGGDARTTTSSSSSSAAQGGLESRAVAVGFAANGGKTAARAVAHAHLPVTGGLVAALANATAVANHASRTVAHSSSVASNRATHGSTVAETTAEALSDHGSAATADSASRSLGLGGSSTSAGTTTRSAATGGSRSDVAATAVSSAAGHGSLAHVTSNATGAAKQHSTASTRADSITVAVDGSTATGTANSTAGAQQHGTGFSQSLMESFSLFNGSHTDANSLATVHGSKRGTGWSRDKAVGIGLWSSKAATNTTTQVVSSKLGLAVVTSVVRSVAAQGRFACADAIRKTAAEAITGPQINFNDVTLHLGHKVPQKCLTSYKDLTEKALIKARLDDADQSSAADVRMFEQMRADINAGMQQALQQAQAQVEHYHQQALQP